MSDVSISGECHRVVDRGVAGDRAGGAGDAAMSDLPLPETLIDAVARRIFEYASIGEHEQRFARSVIETALAFRDESGHRVVWSAEEVEPLIEVVRAFVDWGDSPDDDYSGLMDAARAALARVRGPEPDHARTPEQHEQWIDLVHGPEACPTCGSDNRERFLDGCGDTGQPIDMTIDGDLVYGSPDAWHRGPEKRVSE